MKLDKFTEAYIECALWSSTDEDGEPLDGVYSIDDLAEATVKAMSEDCRDFQESNGDLLWLSGMSQEQAGHDFWLTRNGHGAGFWDRGLGETGTKLTDKAHVYGGVDLYVGDDGKIYQS